jgi:hypothetical protein
VGTSEEAIAVQSLKDLGLKGHRIYLEEGCPRHDLYGVVRENQVFTVAGKYVRALREECGKAKSDFNDVSLIRELAQRNPGLFLQVTARETEEIVDEMTYTYYSRVTRLNVTLGNYRRGFLRQFGEVPPQLEATIDTLKRERWKLTNRFWNFDKVAGALNIRGLGSITVAAILTKANPKRFDSLQAYLRYCGMRAEARTLGNYSRRVQAIYYQLGRDVVLHKDPTFYGLYLKVKGDLRARFPHYRKGKIDGMARNRLATLLAKHLYRAFRAMPEDS